MKIKTFCCDVLVAGTGGAGLKTAVSLLENEPGIKVALVSKGAAGRCGTTANAVSDRMAFHATMPYTPPAREKDNWMYHAEDIFEIGRKVSDWPLAEILAKESAEAVCYLESIGVPFAKDSMGKLSQFLTDGSIYPRACFTGPYTASDMEKALLKRLKAFAFKAYEGFMLADVVLDAKGRVAGAVCVGKDNNSVFFRTGFVVAATGGAGGIFQNNCFPSGMTGDGYGAALRCGAELVNMEFIQFGLCSKKLKVACSGSFMRAVPKIVDEKGEEVLARVYKKPEDIFRVTFRKGASWPVSFEEESKVLDVLAYRKGRLFLDYTRNPSGWEKKNIGGDIRKWYAEKGIEPAGKYPYQRLMAINPEIYGHFFKRGIDVSKAKVEVFSAAQHFQGGIKIDENGESTVKGLFACGEAAGGQHGANRPGGSALLDTQVFGRRAAAEILRRLKKERLPLNIKNADGILKNYSGDMREEELKGIFRRIKRDCSLRLSVIREEQYLEAIQKSFSEIQKTVKPAKNLRLYLEVYNALLTALAVLKSCRKRKESRGPHLFWEGDTPVPFDKYFDGKYIVVKMQGGQLKTSLRKVQFNERTSL